MGEDVVEGGGKEGRTDGRTDGERERAGGGEGKEEGRERHSVRQSVGVPWLQGRALHACLLWQMLVVWTRCVFV